MKRLTLLTLLAWALCGNALAAVIEGNPSGAITLTFVYDYQCPYSHAMYATIQELIGRYPNLKVRMLPVAALNETSLYEAAAAIAASNSNQFAAFSNRVMTASNLSDDQVTTLLRQMGLENKAFDALMHSEAVERQLDQGEDIMAKTQHHNVPMVLIYPSEGSLSSSLVIVGNQPLMVLVQAIDQVQSTITTRRNKT